MKYYPRIEMENGGNHDFPRLARESGFYFNLYRGRVDWKHIDSLDIDRLIRERDLESLQSVFASISSCNLSGEYDVKVLDPNFVKLFRLSQLSVDYLQYCRNYLDHCVIVLQEQLRVALHEVEQLQHERTSREDQIKQLTRKLKEKSRLGSNNGLTTNVADFASSAPGVNSGFSQPSFSCVPCNKLFVSAIFLQRHIMRRHPEQVKLQNEAESLRLKVHQMQERLQKAEELLKQYKCSVEAENEGRSSKQEKENAEKGPGEEKVHRSQNTDEELSQWKSRQGDNSQKPSLQAEEDIRALTENVKRQSEEIEALKSQLKSQHYAQESLWQNRLDQLEQRHHSDIDAIRISLSQPNSFTTQAPPTNPLGSTSKELHEKHVQISPPEMVVKGTQVESTPDRMLPPLIQEAFTKPVSSPNVTFSSARTTPSSLNFHGSGPEKKENPEVARNERSLGNRRPTVEQQSPRKEDPPVSGSQSFSRMSVDVSLTETSADESSDSTTRLPRTIESAVQESSSSTEDGIEKLSSLAIHPQVLTPLRKDIEGVMYRSLRELGIDPEWKGVPAATYQSVKANLQHQRNITQKGRRGLVKLREDLSREVDAKTREMYSSETSQKDKQPVRKSPARPPPPRRSPINKPGNEYTAEPRRDRTSNATVVYEEVKNKEDGVTTPKFDQHDAPIPPVRRRSMEKFPIESAKPVPPPRVTPTTAELLADMERLRRQGTVLKAEGSLTTKSNLKSTSSTGNLTKKRVVFLDEKDDFPTVDIGLNDGELGLFQIRNISDANFLNKDRSLSASNVSRDASSTFDAFSTNGSGDPVRSTGETRVARMAREIENQLMNKPLHQSSHLPGTFNRHNSELDLILDDLSSS